MKNIYRFCLSQFIVWFILLGLFSCELADLEGEQPQQDSVAVQVQILVDNNQQTMLVGDSVQASYQIQPDTIEINDIEWSSSSPDVASISDDGHIIAHALGQTVITVGSDEKNVEATFNISVIPTALVDIHLDADIIAAYINEPKQLTLTYEPEDATDKTVTWRTSDNNVVAVDQNGIITPKSYGYAWVEAYQGDQGPNAAAVIIPAYENQLLAANHINTTTHEQKHYIDVYIAALEQSVAVNEVKLYLGSRTDPNATELKTLAPSLSLNPGEAQQIRIEVTEDEAYDLTFGRYLRLDVTIDSVHYYVYLSWFNNFEIEQK